MPSRRLPNSQVSVLRTLTTARDAWKQFPTDRLISPAHWAKLDDAQPTSFLNRYLKESGDVQTALAAQAPATSAKQGESSARGPDGGGGASGVRGGARAGWLIFIPLLKCVGSQSFFI
jgi:hypothetical protein